MNISESQWRILRHALGLAQTDGKHEYRNQYCPGTGSAAERDCIALEAAGLMASREIAWIPGRTYYVTDAGRAVARGA